jgi:hypothetical protein
MRRLLISAASIAVAALALGGISLAQGHSSKAQVIVLKEVATRQAFVNVAGKSKLAPGDQYVLRSALYSSPGGARVGTLRAFCNINFRQQGVCQGMLTFLAGGQLSGMGLTGNGPIAILGGTGRYAGATGQIVQSKVSPHGNVAIWTITLK